MKKLEVEWKHLDQDGSTCERCSSTGETVRQVVQELKGELRARGWEVRFKETLLSGEEIAQSNAVLFNGVPLEEILPAASKGENCCPSCEDLLGLPTLCRTVDYQGRTYEAIPPELIREAARQAINKQKERGSC